jgi:hypothetical protein
MTYVYLRIQNICARLPLVQDRYSQVCHIKSSSDYNGILLILTAICLIVPKFNLLILSELGFALFNIIIYYYYYLILLLILMSPACCLHSHCHGLYIY